MSVRIKICGITSIEDAVAAVNAGADALGFMFYERSPRRISMDMAAAIKNALPPFVVKVGVFADATENVVRSAALCGLNVLQFHGNETPEFLKRFSPTATIKAFRVQNAASLAMLPTYNTSSWLLDSYTPAQLGGTGTTFNWDLAIQARKLGRPIILAGGLTPENVADAIRKVRPYAVDVSSGVEFAPGKKDPAKIAAFIQAAKSA
ncbi:MAG TPA: phosphoribosylanthranilate isomerase [Verrucomicrobiae bacterium]|nr:phosphoribosylanthranilate isomerase [Verrucomicrobiae bacterium]